MTAVPQPDRAGQPAFRASRAGLRSPPQSRPAKLPPVERHAGTLEWAAVVAVLFGAALVAGGVISIALDKAIAAYLVIGGVIVIVVSVSFWTILMKSVGRRRNTGPESA